MKEFVTTLTARSAQTIMSRFRCLMLVGLFLSQTPPSHAAKYEARTRVSIRAGQWHINDRVLFPGTACEGLLMNVRMVNVTFEDRRRPEFDANVNTDRFIRQIPDYHAHGVRAFTLCLQGGMPGYEGALNSAFNPDGSLRPDYLARVNRVIEACDQHGIVVILGLFCQRQSKLLRDDDAIRAGLVNASRWIQKSGLRNVVVEIANEYPHRGFAHQLIRTPEGMTSLLRLAKQTAPELLFTASGYGDGKVHPDVAATCDFLTPHWNGTKVADIPARVAALKRFGKPIVCNEDDKAGNQYVATLKASVTNGCAYGLMLNEKNQYQPFEFNGAADHQDLYRALKEMTSKKSTLNAQQPHPAALPANGPTPSPALRAPSPPLGERDGVRGIPSREKQIATRKSVNLSSKGNAGELRNHTTYFPPPESKGGWRAVTTNDELETIAGMDKRKLANLRDWLMKSDKRPFAAVVIRHGIIALQVERGNSAATDSRRVASVSKAVCATVLAIASERSQHGLTPRRMTFDDKAFDFIPWAQPLSDPRKADITVKQLLNHTSGICPEAVGARNDGTWDYILGHSGDARTAKLAFEPGTACGYSTHALIHAALVCETVTGEPYDQFAIEALFKPIGIEKWWFQYYDGGNVGRKPSHGLGLPARELARIGYCMLHDGRWGNTQVIPKWFVEQTALPSHNVTTPELRWNLNPAVFTLGWELPARHFPESGKHIAGIPSDARYKPGSGGQLLAFVPSLDLVIARQTGGSGQWDYEDFLRQACAAVLRTAD